jgi:DNA helicase-2/ATP-dependent DNA helicase PcrA
LLEPIAQKLEDEGHSIPGDRRSLLGLIDRLFGDSYDGAKAAPSSADEQEWVSKLFQAYCDGLIASNRLDFGSLLHFARRLLSDRPAVARIVRLSWTHVCVDEFQDTNRAQYDLLRTLVSVDQPNLFVVADDDQIIYQWNGASPERLLALRADFKMSLVQLPENYRCPPQIIAHANLLIAHNRQRTQGKVPLTASKPATAGGIAVRYGVFETAAEELSVLAADLLAGRSPADCVVLARTGRLLGDAAGTLTAAGFEVSVPGRKNEFESPVIRVFYQSLRLANARHDAEILRRLCLAWGDFSGAMIEVGEVLVGAALVGGDYLRAVCDVVGRSQIDVSARSALKEIETAVLDRLDFPDVVERFLTVGWKAETVDQTPELAQEVATWKALHHEICQEHGADGLTLNLYLQKMDLASKAPVPPHNAVRCMTVHGSKGLEFRHVYLIGMAQEIFPSFQALKRGPVSRELEEERRNCFVAITVCRKH